MVKQITQYKQVARIGQFVLAKELTNPNNLKLAILKEDIEWGIDGEVYFVTDFEDWHTPNGTEMNNFIKQYKKYIKEVRFWKTSFLT